MRLRLHQNVVSDDRVHLAFHTRSQNRSVPNLGVLSHHNVVPCLTGRAEANSAIDNRTASYPGAVANVNWTSFSVPGRMAEFYVVFDANIATQDY
jgi:hypothetical protein